MENFPMIVLCDDSKFVAETINNFLWVTFTRCNPANDIYGIESFVLNKHWGCKGSVIFDARKKPHHAPELIKNDDVEKKVDTFITNAFKLTAN
jgi:4-hydroxy-3-polyprenylbenzoate decarboxylase